MARITFTGVSSGNLGDHVGDEPGTVEINRGHLLTQLSLTKIQYMNQVHGNEVVVIDSNSSGIPTCDALVTTDKSIALAVLTADCLPILISSQSVAGAIHAGRKGVTNGIIANTIHQMAKLGASDMQAHIGPAICANCYEVDRKMYEELVARFPELATENSMNNLDLIAAASSQLQGLGLQVQSVDICTKECRDFFSYRREANTGRQGAVISI